MWTGANIDKFYCYFDGMFLWLSRFVWLCEKGYLHYDLPAAHPARPGRGLTCPRNFNFLGYFIVMFIGHAFSAGLRVRNPLGTWKANWKKVDYFCQSVVLCPQKPFIWSLSVSRSLTSINREIDHNTFDWQGAESSPEIGFISRIMESLLTHKTTKGKCIPF